MASSNSKNGSGGQNKRPKSPRYSDRYGSNRPNPYTGYLPPGASGGKVYQPQAINPSKYSHLTETNANLVAEAAEREEMQKLSAENEAQMAERRRAGIESATEVIAAEREQILRLEAELEAAKQVIQEQQEKIEQGKKEEAAPAEPEKAPSQPNDDLPAEKPKSAFSGIIAQEFAAAKQTQSEQAQPEQTQSEQTQSEQTKSEKVQPEQVQPEQAQSEQKEPEPEKKPETAPAVQQLKRGHEYSSARSKNRRRVVKPQVRQLSAEEADRIREAAAAEMTTEVLIENIASAAEQAQPEQTKSEQTQPEQTQPEQAQPEQTQSEQNGQLFSAEADGESAPKDESFDLDFDAAETEHLPDDAYVQPLLLTDPELFPDEPAEEKAAEEEEQPVVIEDIPAKEEQTAEEEAPAVEEQPVIIENIPAKEEQPAKEEAPAEKEQAAEEAPEEEPEEEPVEEADEEEEPVDEEQPVITEETPSKPESEPEDDIKIAYPQKRRRKNASLKAEVALLDSGSDEQYDGPDDGMFLRREHKGRATEVFNIPEGVHLPSYTDDDEFLNKWLSGGEDEEMIKDKKRRRRVSTVIGTVTILLAVLGCAVVMQYIANSITGLTNSEGKNKEYENFVSPVVMCDPAPFETWEGADPQKLLECSILGLTTAKDANYTVDDTNRIVIPSGSVTSSAQRLFGPDVKLDLSALNEIEGGDLYFYSESDDCFHVAITGISQTQAVIIGSPKRSGDIITLTVGYKSESETAADDDSKKDDEEYYKTMVYVLKQTDDGYYISALRLAS